MRKSFTVSLVFVAVLAAATPTFAAQANAPRHQVVEKARDGQVPAFTALLRFLKRNFLPKSNSDIAIPIPGPSGSTSGTGTGN